MTPDQEVAVLDRLLEPVVRCLSPEAARELIGLRGDAVVQGRIEELGDKCTEGELSPDEREEYKFYIVANNVIAILQARARRFLASNGSA